VQDQQDVVGRRGRLAGLRQVQLAGGEVQRLQGAAAGIGEAVDALGVGDRAVADHQVQLAMDVLARHGRPVGQRAGAGDRAVLQGAQHLDVLDQDRRQAGGEFGRSYRLHGGAEFQCDLGQRGRRGGCGRRVPTA
jgi:hypothetical protein